MKKRTPNNSSGRSWLLGLAAKTSMIAAVLLFVLGLSSAFATDFCVNPGFEDAGVNPPPDYTQGAWPWTYWGGTGGAVANPYPDANNSSAVVWSNFGNPDYVNVAAQNNMSGMWLIPGATYHIHAQYYVPSSEVGPGITPRAGIYLSMMQNSPGQYGLLDPRYPDANPAPLSANVPTDQWFTFDFDWVNPGTTVEQVNYGSFRLYGGTNGTTIQVNNPGGYFDNCQISSAAYTGVINGVIKNSSGPLANATVQIVYKGGVLNTVTTAADGVFSFADLIPGESYDVAVVCPTYLGASRTANASANLGDIVLDADPNYDADMLFNVRSSDLTAAAGDPTGNWPTVNPSGAFLTPINTPTVAEINGQKWEMNVYADADAFQFPGPGTGGAWDAIPVNGATIVAAVRPIYGSADTRGEVVDIMYDRLVLAVNPANGRIIVARQGSWWDSGAVTIPNGQITVLSLVVQPDGSFKVYANGTQVMDITDTAQGMLALDPNVPWGAAHTHYVNVGRNQPDGWPTFSGNIGDVAVWKIALDDARRTTLEASLASKFGTASVYTVTATAGAGGSITPSGAVAVPQNSSKTFNISTDYGFVLNDVLVDGASVGAVTNYTFSNVTADHTIAVSWNELPSISGTVTGPSGPIYSAFVSLSSNPDGSSPVVTRTTDNLGQYKVTPPDPNGTYYLIAKKGGYVTSAVKTVAMTGSSVTAQDFALAKSAGLDPLVVLDAAGLAAGPLTSWANTGTLGGTFNSFDAASVPTVGSDYGMQAVQFAQPTQDAAGRQTLVGSMPTPPQITGSSDWTISAYLFRYDASVNSDNAYMCWAGRSYNDGNTAEFCYRNNQAYIHWGNDVGFTTVPSEGAWHWVTITYDGTTEKVYVDGTLDRSDARSLNLHAAGLMMIGGADFQDMRGEDQYWRYNGAIAKLEIYDQALTSTQVAVAVGAATYNWAGPDNGNWSNPANWNSAVPGEGNIATFSDSASAGAHVNLDIWTYLKGIEFNSIAPDTTITTTDRASYQLYFLNDVSPSTIGAEAGSHAINVDFSAPAGLTKSGPGTISLGGATADMGTLRVEGGELIVADTVGVASGSGTTVTAGGKLTITGTFTTSSHDQIIGDAGKVGTLELSGTGSWTHTGGGVFQVGNDGVGCVGTLIVKDNAVLDSEAGITIGVGWGGGCTGIVNQTGGRVTDRSTGGTGFGWAVGNGSSGTWNFDGGVLETAQLWGDGQGQNVMNFNGGTLRALTDTWNTNFITGITHAYVQDGGAIIDDNGFSLQLDQALEHGTGAAIDGGLTKLGAGSLALNWVSTYTGPTKVMAGTLIVTNGTRLPATALEIAASATLELDYTGTRSIASLTIAGVSKAPGVYGSAASGAANVDSHFTGTGTVTVAPPTPTLPVTGFTMPGGTPTFVVPTVSGYQYRLVYKDHLTDATWTPVGATWTPGTGGNVTLSDSTAAAMPQRFYRLEVQ